MFCVADCRYMKRLAEKEYGCGFYMFRLGTMYSFSTEQVETLRCSECMNETLEHLKSKLNLMGADRAASF